jgi:transcriptional regulator with XRE-family HTH domain
MKWRDYDFGQSVTWAIDPVGTGKRLRKYRNGYSLSQDDIADFFVLAGSAISKQSISNWERGKGLPTIDHMALLAYGLYHVGLEDLYVRYGSCERADSDDQPAHLFVLSMIIIQLDMLH